MTDRIDRARFQTATRQWQTLVDVQLVHANLIPDESKSGTVEDLYVFRDDAGRPLLEFTLEAPSGWTLSWSIGLGGGHEVRPTTLQTLAGGGFTGRFEGLGPPTDYRIEYRGHDVSIWLASDSGDAVSRATGRWNRGLEDRKGSLAPEVFDWVERRIIDAHRRPG